ncbi:MAG: toll/interleukin-1 receptor domain-containing protein [Candidatus Pacebacteria bacterium]|nr:toll/interleukin-1 receptor domain-containing protein [Candidatus Paceibacterota bacterium]
MMAIADPTRTPKRACIIYASEDKILTDKLAAGLRSPALQVWSAEDLNHGKWEQRVKKEIRESDVVIPIVSKHTQDKPIFVDEWDFAVTQNRPIFPFVIDTSGTPLGKGGYSRTDARDWTGDLSHPGFISLKQKLSDHFAEGIIACEQPKAVSIGGKSLSLPAFVFSLSSFETQLNPLNGLQLMGNLAPPACLISAYDAKTHIGKRRNAKFWIAVDALRRSESLLFLDSGNYEASRNHDYRSSENTDGWCVELFHEVALQVAADIVFSYDHVDPKGSNAKIVKNILANYERDRFKTGLGPGTLCPIVHLPMGTLDIATSAVEIVVQIAQEIRPTLIAIPERELGDGILTRMKTVKAIRRALDNTGFYQPLHILGTGNPTSIAALALCGGDCFDGLEWCRTAANYETNSLLHFQHFDALYANFGGRVRKKEARSLVELGSAPFALRVASYNYDYFCDWMDYVQTMLRSAEPEKLLRQIPYIGTVLALAYNS